MRLRASSIYYWPETFARRIFPRATLMFICLFSSPRIHIVAVFVERIHRVHTSLVHVLLDTISRVFLQRGKPSLCVGVQFWIDCEYLHFAHTHIQARACGAAYELHP